MFVCVCVYVDVDVFLGITHHQSSWNLAKVFILRTDSYGTDLSNGVSHLNNSITEFAQPYETEFMLISSTCVIVFVG